MFQLGSFRWEQGRQGSGYRKLLLGQGSVGTEGRMLWDSWVLDYPDGSHIPTHVDAVPGRRHYRLNVVLWGARGGGDFDGGAILRIGRRLTFFRPDITPHSVSRVEGRRVVLSLGFAL